MSIKQIQCRLVAPEEYLSHLWQLMADKNTPLINELLHKVTKHPDFDKWLQKGGLDNAELKKICNSLKSQPHFSNQPSRFYTSAQSLVKYTYKSWFALQKKRQRKIEGKERWLNMLKSDEELKQESNCNLDEIRAKAHEILTQFNFKSTSKNKEREISHKNQVNLSTNKVFYSLFEAYEKEQDSLTKCALVYLLKNNFKLSDLEEKPDDYTQRRKAKEIEIMRLKEQLKCRIPKGRDLDGEKWLDILKTATYNAPKDEAEAKFWQNTLLQKDNSVPFPVAYETNEDLTWSMNDKGRISVRFNGLRKHSFEIYCDQRQLHYFQHFYQDWKILHDNQETYSSGLFTLRSATLVWSKNQKNEKGKKEKINPWNTHNLYLHCSLETSLLTLQGTELVRLQKLSETGKQIKNMKQKGELSDNQQAYLKRQETKRSKLNNSFPNRRNKSLYQGLSHVLVGVSLDIVEPATVAVIDASIKQVIKYQSLRQLLGDDFKLINRQRRQQIQLAKAREKAYKKGVNYHTKESDLSKYINRLIAKKIVEIAQYYRAGSVVLPKIGDIREIRESEIKAKAEKKFPGEKKLQQQYAKDYRCSIHRWSYAQLIQSIHDKASQAGIAIEFGTQPNYGTKQEKARDLAFYTYDCRSTKTN